MVPKDNKITRVKINIKFKAIRTEANIKSSIFKAIKDIV